MADDERAMSPMVLSTAEARVELEELYEREVSTVHGFLLARCGSVTLAEDLTTEVFVNAATRFGQGRSEEVSGAWLMVVARRRLVDHWRRVEGQRRRLERLEREQILAVDGDSADDRVLAALRSLSTRQRAALTLRYMDEFSVSEVSAELEVGYRAAESLLARARRSFVRAYEAQL